MSDSLRPSLALGVAAAIIFSLTTAVQAQDAASLVRRVRQREAWVDQVDSLVLKAEGGWERTEQGIAKRRKELEKQFPGADVSGFPDLKPSQAETVELAFDRKRVRLRVVMPGQSEDLRVWDGNRFILHDRYESAPDRAGYLINRDPKKWLYWLVWVNFGSFRAGPHRFWWVDANESDRAAQIAGKPEDFVYGGQVDYHGTACHVVNHWTSWTTLYISVDDSHLCGIKSGAHTTPRFRRWFLDQLNKRGHDFRDQADLDNRAASITPDDREAIAREGAKLMPEIVDALHEFWLSDEKEAAPGCWLPFTQRLIRYELDDDGLPFVAARNTMTITEARVNAPLPDSLFAVDFQEGEWINDQLHEPPVRYRHKASMTTEEWGAIVAEGRKRAQRERDYEQKQAALIGREATPFAPEATWLNSEPIANTQLAGKVVLLALWAEWCGPCRNDFPTLSAIQKRLADKVVIIGVHPPGSEPEAIRKVLNDFEIRYPIYIDQPAAPGVTAWGRLFEAYGVDRIPHAVLIDTHGRIAATGELGQVITKAGELVGKPL